MIGKGILLFIVLTAWISAVQAAVVKDLQFESVPPDAEVSLLQGTRQESLGTTPLTYQAEFHSDISILRFVVKKSGYKTQTIEVDARQKKVVVKLTSQGFAADPGTINDPMLSNMQARLAPAIDRTLSKKLAVKGKYSLELASPVRVARLDDKNLLILSMTLGTTKSNTTPIVQGQHEESLRSIWGQLGPKLMMPLGVAVRSERQLHGIVLDLDCSRPHHSFKVSSRMESRTETECVPGTEMRQEYNPCLRHRMNTYYDASLGRVVTREGGCEGGYETKSVYNPCLTKVPVTRTQVKIDPKATTVAFQSRAQYVMSMELIKLAGTQDEGFSRLGVLLTNEQGEIVIKRGFVPSSLPRIPK
jgi:hypothetical protein